jgi:putative intracellular protease/amidase
MGMLCAEATANPLDVSHPLKSVLQTTYDGIFIPGGHGVMWDMIDNSDLANLIASHFESGKIVSSVCHGPAAFANVKLKDGSYMVKNKKVDFFVHRLFSALHAMHLQCSDCKISGCTIYIN